MNKSVAEVMHLVRRGRAARAVRYRARSRYSTSFADEAVVGFSATTVDMVRARWFRDIPSGLGMDEADSLEAVCYP
jgi:hypothetical protein